MTRRAKTRAILVTAFTVTSLILTSVWAFGLWPNIATVTILIVWLAAGVTDERSRRLERWRDWREPRAP